MDPELYGRLVVVDLARVADPEVVRATVEVLRRSAGGLLDQLCVKMYEIANVLVVEDVLRRNAIVLQTVPLRAGLGVLNALS